MKRWQRAVGLGAGAVVALGLAGFFGFVPGIVDARANSVVTSPPYRASERAQRLHASLTIADLHADLLLWPRDPLWRGRRGHTDVPRLIEGNVALQVFSAVTKAPRGLNYERNAGTSDMVTPLVVAERWPSATWTSLTARALYQSHRLHQAAARSAGRLVVIRSAAELDRYLARRRAEPGLTAGLLAIEGLHALDGKLENLDTLYAAGFRMMGLVHFFDNEVAGSAHGVGKGGLTPLGRAAIRRMEQLGVLVDMAHAAPRTIDDVLEVATRPVVVSHTGVQGTCPGPRNLSDQHVRRIAARGGVIGIGFWNAAVCDISPAGIARAIRYAADLAGVEHVALGSDFDGATRTYFDASGLVLVTDALLAAGFTPREIALIMGENAVRLLRASLPRE